MPWEYYYYMSCLGRLRHTFHRCSWWWLPRIVIRIDRHRRKSDRETTFDNNVVRMAKFRLFNLVNWDRKRFVVNDGTHIVLRWWGLMGKRRADRVPDISTCVAVLLILSRQQSGSPLEPRNDLRDRKRPRAGNQWFCLRPSFVMEVVTSYRSRRWGSRAESMSAISIIRQVQHKWNKYLLSLFVTILS